MSFGTQNYTAPKNLCRKEKARGKELNLGFPHVVWVSKPQICSSVFRLPSLTRETYSFGGYRTLTAGIIAIPTVHTLPNNEL